ncbi:MAG: xanthine dehydrogenase accessory protein XdhC [Pseudomonadota bacterium]|nr:xanthine dehydrogenase accessory protein XdhC [Pseudomonadota bacterium]
MDEWTLAARQPAVLVTVAIVEGSGPREPGARMLVAAAELAGTVGGGHLELRAIEIGRAMLLDGRARHFERFALGPSLGQCCGGVVHLAFELADPCQAQLLAARRADDTWRLAALDGAPDSALFDAAGVRLAGTSAPVFARTRGTHVMQEQDGRRWLVAQVAAPRAHVVLFGAGHVGTALVRALANLPCTVTWVDERDDMFPAAVPANVTVEVSDAPEDLVAAAPPGASYLVMTHSHALDQRLAGAILARPEVGWFGLIGSHTKRKQFEHRLRARGADPARIAAMACPIGLAGITSKEPAVIAASVCAQLLLMWEAAAKAEAEAGAPPIRLVVSCRP